MNEFASYFERFTPSAWYKGGVTDRYEANVAREDADYGNLRRPSKYGLKLKATLCVVAVAASTGFANGSAVVNDPIIEASPHAGGLGPSAPYELRQADKASAARSVLGELDAWRTPDSKHKAVFQGLEAKGDAAFKRLLPVTQEQSELRSWAEGLAKSLSL